MLKTRLICGRTGGELHSYGGYDGDPVLGVTTHEKKNGHFAAATRSAAGTTTIIAARSNDGIVLTDLMLTTDKVNGATAIVSITDGSNTVNLIAADLTDAPCNIAIPFVGRWETWRAARVDLITTGVVVATLSLGYFRIPWNTARSYSVWDAER